MFKSAKANKTSEKIIEQIRGAIFEGHLNPGDKLPSEKALMESFQVSRATLREALLSLEVLGFLEIRKGASGGAFVREVGMRNARDCFSNFLHFKNLSLKSLFEVLQIIESYVAEKAARTITQKELKKLENINSECERLMNNNIPIDPRKNEIEYHRIIGSVSGNPILIFILDFILNILVDTKEILEPGEELAHRHIHAHKRIYKALLERNAAKAREEMIRHVRDVERELLALQKKRGPHGLAVTQRLSEEKHLLKSVTHAKQQISP